MAISLQLSSITVPSPAVLNTSDVVVHNFSYTTTNTIENVVMLSLKCYIDNIIITTDGAPYMIVTLPEGIEIAENTRLIYDNNTITGRGVGMGVVITSTTDNNVMLYWDINKNIVWPPMTFDISFSISFLVTI